MISEYWRPIPGHPGYEASDLGRIRSTMLRVRTPKGTYRIARGKVLKLQKPCNRRIHWIVKLRRGWALYVHDLVAAAFHGPKP